MSSTVSLLYAFTFFAIAASCKTPGGELRVKSDEPTTAQGGLDVNDVSILFPVPVDIGSVGKMLPIGLPTDSGKPLISKDLFDEVLGHFKYKATIDGQEVALDANVDFMDQEQVRLTSGNTVTGKGPFNDYTRWYIVAMRYDPCAPTAEHSLRHSSPRKSLPTTFDPSICQPQLRVTAQPILPTNRFQTPGRKASLTENFFAFGDMSKVPRIGDYAMHLLFSISEEESKAIYQELISIKQACGDLTTGMPLGVQPCLAQERNTGNLGGPLMQRYAGILKKYAHSQIGAASMATRFNNDPWLFMNGVIADGHFQHLPIDAVRKDKDLKINKQGKMIEPFSNGYYEMLSFLNVPNGSPNVQGGSKSFNTRVTPLVYNDKVNATLLSEFNGITDGKNMQTFQPADWVGGPGAKFIGNINNIENPLANDFFSTDCVSCHGAADVSQPYLNAGSPKYALDESAALFNEGRNTIYSKGVDQPVDYDTQLSTKFSTENAFTLPSGYTNLIAPINVPQSIGKFPYGVIHFGYNDVLPQASFRAANESAQVAYEANHFYGHSVDPAPVCRTEAMRRCFGRQFLGMNSSSQLIIENLNLFSTSDCMVEVCPQRLTELKKLFDGYANSGPIFYKQYKTKRDVKIVVKPNENKHQLFIPKGTVVRGRPTTEPVDAGQSRFDPLGTIPVRSAVDGRDYFSAYQSVVEGSFADNFAEDSGQAP